MSSPDDCFGRLGHCLACFSFGDVPMTRGGEFRVAEQRRGGGQPSPLCLGARTAL